MTDISFNEMFPSKYLKSADLKGREITLTISHIKMEVLGDDEEPKPVLYFNRAKKGFACNKTNGTVLFEAFGEPVAWPGKSITLFPARVQFGAKMVDSIRVKIPQVETSALPAKPAHEPPPSEFDKADDTSDEIPF
jgi:hypothetical protein